MTRDITVEGWGGNKDYSKTVPILIPETTILLVSTKIRITTWLDTILGTDIAAISYSLPIKFVRFEGKFKWLKTDSSTFKDLDFDVSL